MLRWDCGCTKKSDRIIFYNSPQDRFGLRIEDKTDIVVNFEIKNLEV